MASKNLVQNLKMCAHNCNDAQVIIWESMIEYQIGEKVNKKKTKMFLQA